LRAKETYDRRLNNTEIGTHCSLRSALPVRSVRHVGLFLRQLRPLDRVNALVPIAFDFFLVRGVERLLQPIENRFGWILAMAASIALMPARHCAFWSAHAEPPVNIRIDTVAAQTPLRTGNLL